MKNIKICYSIRDNIGDAINPYIVERVLGYHSTHADAYHCQISGIGSGLGRFFYDPNAFTAKGRIKRSVFRYLYSRPVVLWSSGFIATPSGHEQKTRANILPAAVRGRLSLQHVEKLLGHSCDNCVTGDAGLLAAELLEKPLEKQYALGIIPHDNERNCEAYRDLQKNIPNSILIDVRGDVLARLRLIAQCECIVSSSLHGLIIADGFHIPNRRVILTGRLAGDGFKFADYYSSYDLSPSPLNLNETPTFSLDSVYDHYQLTPSIIEDKKKQLSQAFTRHLF